VTPTFAKPRGTYQRPPELSVGRLPGNERCDGLPAVRREDDVDAVIPPVRAGNAEKQREPPPEAEPAFLAQFTREDERAPDLVEIAAGKLLDAVEEDLECVADGLRQVYLTPRFHALYDARG